MPPPRRSRPFGDLEASVMELLWDAQQPLLVRDVVDLMRPQRVLAYTTIMTVLDNLHRKGWLDRVRDGRAWRYSPVLGRQAYTATLMREALAVSDDRAGVLARFVEEMDPQDAAALADLLRSPGDRPEAPKGRRHDGRRSADALRGRRRRPRPGGVPPVRLAGPCATVGSRRGAGRGVVGPLRAAPGRRHAPAPGQRPDDRHRSPGRRVPHPSARRLRLTRWCGGRRPGAGAVDRPGDADGVRRGSVVPRPPDRAAPSPAADPPGRTQAGGGLRRPSSSSTPRARPHTASRDDAPPSSSPAAPWRSSPPGS